jgi:hypothetical protein
MFFESSAIIAPVIRHTKRLSAVLAEDLHLCRDASVLGAAV